MSFFRSKIFLQLVILFIAWRVLLIIVSIFAPLFFVYAPTFPYYDSLLPSYHLPQWLYSWANFDGVHYLTITEKGYLGTGLIQAFFPLFPLFIRLVTLVVNNALLTGLLVSNLSFLIAIILFFKLTEMKFSRQVAWTSVLLFVSFPTSFYGGALYNESLFLCFVFGSFFFAEKKRWFLAGCLAGFASATRVVGIFLIPALFLEVLSNNYLKDQPLFKSIDLKKNSLKIISILVGCLGLFLYMLYLKVVFDDSLYFSHVQSQFGSGRENNFVLLPQVLWRGIKILITVPFDLRWWTYFQELFFTISSLFLLFLAVFKRFKLPFSWISFSVLAILLPTTTGTLSSMPRYVLVAFPIFVILALLCRTNYVKTVVIAVFTVALILNTALFIQGYWIS